MPTVAELEALALQIRDEVNPGANSALRIGTNAVEQASAFDQLGLSPSQSVIPIPGKIIPRSGGSNILAVDYPDGATNENALSLSLVYRGLVSVGMDDSGSQSATAYFEAIASILWRKDGTFVATDATTFLGPTSLYDDAALNEIQDLDIYFNSTGTRSATLRAEATLTGSSTKNPILSGLLSAFWFSQYGTIPSFTLL